MEYRSAGSVIFALVVIFGLLIWYEVTVWRQCLQTDPWWYCLKVLR